MDSKNAASTPRPTVPEPTLSTLSPSRGIILPLVDFAVVTTSEITKSILRESWNVGGQAVNWLAATAVSFLAPGYRSAARARLDQSESLQDVIGSTRAQPGSRSPWPRVGEDEVLLSNAQTSLLRQQPNINHGKALFERSEFVAHRGKPTALDRASCGGLTEVKLAALAFIDRSALRLRLCAREAVRGGWSGLCCWCCRRSRALTAPPNVHIVSPARLVLSGHAESMQHRPPSDVDPAVSPAPSRHLPTPSAPPSGSATQHLITRVCGYTAEVHAVRTVDGYVLSLLRIPRIGSSRVALFQHGIVDTASAWVSTGSVFSLAARAYQRGYDVFLCNLRGTNDAMAANGMVLGGGLMGGPLSPPGAAAAPASSPSLPKAHDELLPSDGAFWDFSVDDHALDVAGHVRYVRRLKRAERSQRKALQSQAAEHQRAAERARHQWREHDGGGSRTPRLDALPVAERRALSIPRPLAGVAVGSADEIAESPTCAPREGDARTPDSDRSPQALPEGSPAPAPAAPPGPDDLDDVRIVAIGHSMGGCVLLMYLLVCAALRRPTGLTRVILLSPAGLHRHLPTPHRLVLLTCYYLGVVAGSRPFPQRSPVLQVRLLIACVRCSGEASKRDFPPPRYLQRLVALALQDLKMLQGTVRVFVGASYAGNPPWCTPPRPPSSDSESS